MLSAGDRKGTEAGTPLLRYDQSAGRSRFATRTVMDQPTTTLYVKKGRRYVPYGNVADWHHDGDRMQAGEFRLTHCVGDGSTRYYYNITPDNAAFLAAAGIARVAMEEAIREAAKFNPKEAMPLTPQQQEIIQRFRDEMAAAGGLLPIYWTNGTAAEIAAAGVAAVQAAVGEAQP